MIRHLCMSMVAKFTGEHPRLEYCTFDTTLTDVIRSIEEELVVKNVEPTEPFNSEYNYLARDGRIPEKILDRLESCSGESRFNMIKGMRKMFDERELFCCKLCDVRVNGIFSMSKTLNFFRAIGAEYEDVGTMGTLGGPLGIGVVPDMPFRIESELLITCIRVTPVLCTDGPDGFEPVRAPSEWQWNAIKGIFKDRCVHELSRKRNFREGARSKKKAEVVAC